MSSRTESTGQRREGVHGAAPEPARGTHPSPDGRARGALPGGPRSSRRGELMPRAEAFWGAERPRRVVDVMQRPVVFVAEATPAVDVARTLALHGIHGAPVVDEAGRLVGVIAADGFHRAAGLDPGPDYYEATLGTVPPELPGPGRLDPTVPVGRLASHRVLTVAPGETARDAAFRMRAERVHRLLVVDDQERPIGLVTSWDVLSALPEGSAGA